MMTHGFVQLHRKVLNWEWYDDIKTSRLFFHMLLTVNFSDSNFKGYTVLRGQRVCSYKTLTLETGLSEKEIRRAVTNLKATGEITCEKWLKYSVYTLVNFDEYQSLPLTGAGKSQHMDTTKAVSGQGDNNININNINKNKNTPPNPPMGNEDVFKEFLFSETIRDSLDEWFEYKRERGEEYKPTGCRMLLNEAKSRLEEMSASQFIRAINASMACNYKGIVWDKAEEQKKKRSEPSFDIKKLTEEYYEIPQL